MTERPIIFSGEMVRAILAGTKTQTRRMVKPPPDPGCIGSFGRGIPFIRTPNGPVGCSYGQSGDRLWVRETWRAHQQSNGFDGVLYAADMEFLEIGDTRAAAERWLEARWANRMWRPSIHMPRWASRIALEITGVCVERLQDISPQDAIAEGIGHRDIDAAVADYATLWDQINGAGSWAANPWVWVVKFMRVQCS